MSVKISELPVLAPEDVAAGDVVAIVDTSEGVTKQVDLSGVLAGVVIPELTLAQATDPYSEVFGTVSGQRLSQASDVKAWVNFNGTGTVAIRASKNVSSVTDNGVGDYTVNFITAMPDANYAVAGIGDGSGTPANPVITSENLTVASAGIGCKGSTDAGRRDVSAISVAIFR